MRGGQSWAAVFIKGRRLGAKQVDGEGEFATAARLPKWRGNSRRTCRPVFMRWKVEVKVTEYCIVSAANAALG